MSGIQPGAAGAGASSGMLRDSGAWLASSSATSSSLGASLGLNRRNRDPLLVSDGWGRFVWAEGWEARAPCPFDLPDTSS